MRVVGYVRVSTDEQAGSGVSLDAQESKVRAWCDLHGHDLVELVSDPGESAGSLSRPGLTRALAMLSDGLAGGLVVAKLDRLTRSVADFESLLAGYFSRRAGCLLLSGSESIDTRSAGGRLILRILVSASQWELEVGHERTENALGHKQSRGERTGSVPYGFDLDHAGPSNSKGRPVRLLKNESEHRVISLMRDMKRVGDSPHRIALQLNALAIPTKTANGPWRHATVAKILDRKPTPETPDADETAPTPT